MANLADSSDELVFAPFGGVGEIGMNLSLYGLGRDRSRQWLAVDLGVAFAGDDLPGVDLIVPDLSYLESRKGQVKGLVLTHGHEDHIGAVPYVLPHVDGPVYGPPLALALVAWFVARVVPMPDRVDWILVNIKKLNIFWSLFNLLPMLPLDLVPARERLLRQVRVLRVGIGKSEDPRRAVARSACVAELELLDEDRAGTAACERAQRRNSCDPPSYDDDVDLAPHRRDPTQLGALELPRHL